MFSFFSVRKKQPIDITSFVREQIDAADMSSYLHIEDIKQTPSRQVIVALLAQRFDNPQLLESFRLVLQEKISNLAKFSSVLVVFTADQAVPAVSQSPPVEKPAVKEPQTSASSLLAGIDVIAVASGKGGVGKSTVAVNLAIALSQKGRKVGILDADIYGPSLPRLLGISNQKAVHGEDERLMPIDIHGIKAMSMGFMVDEAAPMIWRGPMVQSALLQMIRDVAWDGIDTLVIDMPPGTGDIHLTLAQRVPLAGGVVVSTPQDIALIDARKGLEMFKKVAVPILGIVENMSYYICPSCGDRANIFGHGGARDEALKLSVPFLGEIPLNATIRALSDAGTPVTLSAIKSEQAESFMQIAQNVLAGLNAIKRPAPSIRMID